MLIKPPLNNATTGTSAANSLGSLLGEGTAEGRVVLTLSFPGTGWLIYLLLRSVCICNHMGRVFLLPTPPLPFTPSLARLRGLRSHPPLQPANVYGLGPGHCSGSSSTLQASFLHHLSLVLKVPSFCWLPRKILSNLSLKSEAQMPWWDLAANKGV